MNEEEIVSGASAHAREDQEVSTEAKEDVVAAGDVEELFQLEGELFASDDAKEFKDLVESFVNEHGLPKEKAQTLAELVRKGSEAAASAFEAKAQEAISAHAEEMEKKANADLEDFCMDFFTSSEEQQNIVDFAKDKWCAKHGLNDEEAAVLLSNKSFLKAMQNERQNWRNSSPQVISEVKRANDRDEFQNKLYNELMNGF